MRTTSSLESLNAVLRRSIPNHPHIYKFTDRLRLHEYSKYLDMLKAVKSNISLTPVRRKKRDQQRDEKIKYFTEMLKTDVDMHAGDFLLKLADENLFPYIGIICLRF